MSLTPLRLVEFPNRPGASCATWQYLLLCQANNMHICLQSGRDTVSCMSVCNRLAPRDWHGRRVCLSLREPHKCVI